MKFQVGDIVSPSGSSDNYYKVLKSYLKKIGGKEKEYVDLFCIGSGETFGGIFDSRLEVIKRKSIRNGHHLTSIFK